MPWARGEPHSRFCRRMVWLCDRSCLWLPECCLFSPSPPIPDATGIWPSYSHVFLALPSYSGNWRDLGSTLNDLAASLQALLALRRPSNRVSVLFLKPIFLCPSSSHLVSHPFVLSPLLPAPTIHSRWIYTSWILILPGPKLPMAMSWTPYNSYPLQLNFLPTHFACWSSWV